MEQKNNQTNDKNSSKAWLTIVILIIAIAIVAYFYYSNQKGQGENFQETVVINETEPGKSMVINFSNPKKSAHYESNTPAHGAVLAAPPINIVIDFNFDLAKPSAISIKNEGREYGLGETKIDEGKLALRRDMNPNAPDGLYKVEYKACWPDGSCHDGHFQFAIDRSKAEDFMDMREKQEVKIDMQNISFRPMRVRISRGTKVTWINSDGVAHFVNTDSHPAHTYFPEQNSRSLKKDDSFSLTFEKEGIYPYHCSAHAANMKGEILVESE